jgi:hypothetical protein
VENKFERLNVFGAGEMYDEKKTLFFKNCACKKQLYLLE